MERVEVWYTPTRLTPRPQNAYHTWSSWHPAWRNNSTAAKMNLFLLCHRKLSPSMWYPADAYYTQRILGWWNVCVCDLSQFIVSSAHISSSKTGVLAHHIHSREALSYGSQLRRTRDRRACLEAHRPVHQISQYWVGWKSTLTNTVMWHLTQGRMRSQASSLISWFP